MYPWRIYTSFYFFFTSFIYKFLLRLSSWKYYTSWFSSFTIYYNCAVVVASVVRFLVLTRVVPLVLILSAIPRNLRKLMQVFFFLHFKGVMALWHTKQLWELLFFLVNLHQKEIPTQRAHFSRLVLIVQIIGYVVSMTLFKATIHKTKHSKA